MIYPGDFLNVDNGGDTTLVLTWNGRSVKIPPGQRGLATFEQVVNHFGHPAAAETQQRIEDPTGAWHMVPTREEERYRVSIKQGWDLRASTTGGLQVLTAPPPIVVTDQDGNRVWTVAEDPDGDHQMPAVDASSRTDTPADQIAYLKRQMAQLEAAYGLGGPGGGAATAVDASSRSLAVPGASQPAADQGDLPDLDVPTDD